ncbi:MAG: hypothetical protein JRF53_04745 [Deltaproteobacteria bacterium]|nr:hypothetical protein [Deltaproteobacteria bacterium]MBW2343310.1 hypothetical protein [Deltaproteobacteria bacterium]
MTRERTKVREKIVPEDREVQSGKRLRLQRFGMALSSYAVVTLGVAFLEMRAHITGRQYFSKRGGVNNPIKGKSGWETVRTLFMFKKGQKPDKVTLNLVINGKGTVCIDNITLLKVKG